MKGVLYMSKTRAIRPTRRQKEAIYNKRLSPNNWLVVKEAEGFLTIVHKETQKQRVIAM